MGWLDFKGVCFHSKGQGIKPLGGVVCGEQWYVDRIFFYRIPIIGV